MACRDLRGVAEGGRAVCGRVEMACPLGERTGQRVLRASLFSYQRPRWMAMLLEG